MKNLMVLVALLFCLNVHAEEKIVGEYFLYDVLSEVLAASEKSSFNIHQGWAVTAAILRCYNPEGTVGVNDKPYCALDSIGNSFSEEEILDKSLTESLWNLLSDSKLTYYGVHQGWGVLAATLRCVNPSGTGKPTDKPYCALDSIN